MSLNWWNENKMKLAPVSALIMWAVSVVCFVFGLSFKNPMGVLVGSVDLSIVIAFALSIANTIIQLIGNGQDFERMDGVFRIGWYSSYALGIASNVNALLGILGIDNPMLKWTVAVSLGSMIEIMPEKLVIIWLKTVTTKPKTPAQTQWSKPQTSQNNPNKYVPKNKPNHFQTNQSKHIQPMPSRPFPPSSSYLKAIQEMEEGEE